MKTEATHTPGPWHVAWLPHNCTAEIETVDQGQGYRHLTNALPMCASPDEPVEIIEGRRYSAEACASARLMAAAPELLTALKQLVTWASYYTAPSTPLLNAALELADDAITKAGAETWSTQFAKDYWAMRARLKCPC